jgi:2-hydroxy-3-keto-5-methylthiopentenyl-1-phosphate phosphatase
MIGDGASDFCVAEAADFVFAKGKLIAHCRAKEIPHAAIHGFADALALLPGLIEGKPAAVPSLVPVLSNAALA